MLWRISTTEKKCLHTWKITIILCVLCVFEIAKQLLTCCLLYLAPWMNSNILYSLLKRELSQVVLLCEVIYEMFHILNCGFWNQVSYDHRSYEHNSSNCVWKPEKVRTSTGFEPVTSWYQCDALINWAVKPLTLEAGHLWVYSKVLINKIMCGCLDIWKFSSRVQLNISLIHCTDSWETKFVSLRAHVLLSIHYNTWTVLDVWKLFKGKGGFFVRNYIFVHRSSPSFP